MSDVAETYYRISPSIWKTFPGEDERTMACYLIACPHRTTEGLFALSLGYMAADLRWDVPRAQAALSQVIDKGLVKYDADAEVCLIVKALKRQPPANRNVCKAALKRLAGLPETRLWDDFYELAQRYCGTFAKELRKGFPERFRIASDSAESETVSGTVTGTHTETSSSSSSSNSSSREEADASVEPRLDAARTRLKAGAVQRVFDHWRTTTNRHGAQLLPERVTILNARLKHFSEEDLMRAVDGSQTDDAVDVKTGHRYDDFKNIFRNGDNVETNIGRAEKANATGDTRSFIQRLNAGGQAA